MKKNTKKYSAVLLAAILASLTLLYPVSAADTGLPAPLDKIDSVLQEKLDDMGDGDTVDVSVWLKDIDYEQVANDVTDKLETMHQSGKVSAQALLLPQDDLAAMSQSAQNNAVSAYSAEPVQGLDPSQITAEDAQEFIETKREVTAQKYEEQNTRLFNSLFPKQKQSWFRTVQQEQPEVIYSCKYAPNVMLTLTKSQVESAARSADVEELYYYDNTVAPEDLQPEEPLALEASPQTVAASNISLSYQSSTGVANMRDYNHADGTGIKLGQIEMSVPRIESRVFDHMRNAQDSSKDKIHILMDLENYEANRDHAWAVATLMVGKTTEFTSIVPNAELYCVGVLDSTNRQHWKEGMELMLEAGVNVINASHTFSGESNYGVYGDSCK